MKVLVCGSRRWADYAAIETRIAALPPGTEIIHGGAHGVDSLAGMAAVELGFPEHVYPADWRRHGRRAGPIRNRLMLDQDPDLVIAFWDCSSRGTLDTITEARKRGIQTEVHSAMLTPLPNPKQGGDT